MEKFEDIFDEKLTKTERAELIQGHLQQLNREQLLPFLERYNLSDQGTDKNLKSRLNRYLRREAFGWKANWNPETDERAPPPPPPIPEPKNEMDDTQRNDENAREETTVEPAMGEGTDITVQTTENVNPHSTPQDRNDMDTNDGLSDPNLGSVAGDNEKVPDF